MSQCRVSTEAVRKIADFGNTMSNTSDGFGNKVTVGATDSGVKNESVRRSADEGNKIARFKGMSINIFPIFSEKTCLQMS